MLKAQKRGEGVHFRVQIVAGANKKTGWRRISWTGAASIYLFPPKSITHDTVPPPPQPISGTPVATCALSTYHVLYFRCSGIFFVILESKCVGGLKCMVTSCPPNNVLPFIFFFSEKGTKDQLDVSQFSGSMFFLQELAAKVGCGLVASE